MGGALGGGGGAGDELARRRRGRAGLVLAVVALLCVSFPVPVLADLADATTTCVVDSLGSPTCGPPTDQRAGEVIVSVLLKEASGVMCIDSNGCTAGTLAGTLGGVSADSVACTTGTAYCNLVWNSFTTSGSQQLAVTLGGAAVKDSPYTLVLAAADNGLTSSSQSDITGTGATGGAANTDLVFVFTLRDQYGNLVGTTTATCSDLTMVMSLASSSSQITPTCSHVGGGVFHGAFKTTVAGTWTISVSGGGLVATNSTVISPLAYSVAHSTVTTGVDVPRANAAGSMRLVARDEFGNELTETSDPGIGWSMSVTGFTAVDGGAGGLPPMTFGAPSWVSGGTYTVAFQSTRSGLFSITVKVGSDTVGGSAVTETVTPNLLSGAAMAPGGNYTDVVVAGATNPFTLTGKDAYGNVHTTGPVTFTATIGNATHPSVSLLDLATVAGTGGEGSSSYSVTVGGSYALTLTLTGSGDFVGGATVGASPYAITVNPDESGHPARFSWTPAAAALEGIAGVTFRVQMREVDQYANPRTVSGQLFTATLSGPQTVEALVSDDGGGLYGVAANVTMAGEYTVAVSSSGGAIPVEAFGLTVSPANMSHLGTWRQNYAGYSGGEEGTVSVISRIGIQARDEFANPIPTGGENASLSFTLTACPDWDIACGSGAAPSSGNAAQTFVEDLGGGYYGVSYFTTVGGYYHASVKHDGSDIFGSPFSVLVDAGPTLPPLAYAFGPGIASCGLVLVTGELPNVTACLNASDSVETTFGVRLVDAFGNERITSSGAEDLLVFNTSSVSTLWNGAASGPLSLAESKYSVQQESGVQVVGFMATVSGRYSTDVVHRFCASSLCPTPVITGPISNTPVYVFVAPAEAHAPYSWPAGPGLTLSTAGVASSFLITTRDRFMNDRVGVVSAEGQDSGWSLTLTLGTDDTAGSIVGQPNGTYLASFSVTASGDYTVAIARDGGSLAANASAPGEAATFPMLSFPNVAGVGSFVSSGASFAGQAGWAATVYISAKDDFGNLKSRGGDTFSGLVSALPNTTITQVDYGNGTYGLDFFVTRSGSYPARVLVRGSDISGSPLEVAMIPGPSVAFNSEVTPINLTTAGDTLTLRIVSRDKYFNHRGVGGDAFDMSCDMVGRTDVAVSALVQDLGTGEYAGFCRMIKSGEYVVSLTTSAAGNATNISGSPFGVLVQPGVANPSFSGAFGDACTVSTAGIWSTFQIFARDRFLNPNTGAGTATFFMTVDKWDPETRTNTTVPMCPYAAPSPEWGSLTEFPDGVLGGDASNGTCVSIDLGYGSYVMSYMWTVAATYRSSIAIDTGDGSGRTSISGFDLHVRPTVLSTPNSMAAGAAMSVATAGERMEFTLVSRDVYDNVRTTPGGGLSVTVANSTLPAAATASAEAQPDGTFKVVYSTTRSAVYTVSVRDADTSAPISNDGALLVVKPTLSYPPFFASSGPGLQGGEVDTSVPLRLMGHDEFGNRKTQGGESVSVSIQGGWNTASDGSSRGTVTLGGGVVDLGDGLYDLTYLSTQAGAYLLSIAVTSPATGLPVSVPGSPFSVYVDTGAISAAHSVAFYRNFTTPLQCEGCAANCSCPPWSPAVLGPGLTHEVVAGGMFTFVVLAKDRFGNPRTTGGHDALFLVNMTFESSFGAVGIEHDGMDITVPCPVAYRGGANASNASAEGLHSGEYVVTYPATVSGRYTLHASFGGAPLSNSGHTVDVYPAAPESRMFSSVFPPVALLGEVGYRVTTAGSPSTFSVFARDRFGNRRSVGGDFLTVDVGGMDPETNTWINLTGATESPAWFKYPASWTAGSSGYDPACDVACVSDRSDGSYTVVLRPSVSGMYRVAVRANNGTELICQGGCGDAVPHPYNITTVATEIFPPFCDSNGDGLTAAFAGVLATFQIQARDAYGNKRLTDRFDPVMSALEGRTVLNGEFGSSTVTFRGGFINPDAGACQCTLGTNCVNCETSQCGGEVCGRTEPGYPRVINTHRGLYHVQYLITQAGSYTLQIKKPFGVDEERYTKDAPFPFTLTAGPTDPEKCTSSGDGLYRSVAGDVTTVVVQARDKFGNLREVGGDPINALAQHSEACQGDGAGGCLPCESGDVECAWAGRADGEHKPLTVYANVEDKGNNDYHLIYTITVSGFYSYSLRLNSTHIGGKTITRSPFPLQISPGGLDPGMSTVTGDGARLAQQNRRTEFFLWPRDRFGNSLAGSRERVRINLCSTDIVCPPRTGTAFVTMRLYNKDTGLFHDVNDKYETIIRQPDPNKGSPISVEVNAEADSSSSVVFEIPDLGEYEVTVNVNGIPIRGTPFNMSVFPADPDPSPYKSTVERLDDVAVAGRRATGRLTVRNKYGIRTPEASNKNIVVLHYVSNRPGPDPKVVNRGDGYFDIQFQTTTAGNYQFDVAVSDVSGGHTSIPTSPLVINVLPFIFDAQSSIANVQGLGSVVAGVVVTFTMLSRDTYGNELPQIHPEDDYKATLARSDGTDVLLSAQVDQAPGGRGWIASFVDASLAALTTISGAYRLQVTNKGYQVVNSPFEIKVTPSVVDETKCSLTPNGVDELMTAGTFSTIYMQSRDRFGNNRTDGGDAYVISRNTTSASGGALEYSTTFIGAGITAGNLMFRKVGAYTVFVGLGSVANILNSPFTTYVVPGPAFAANCYNATPVPHQSVAGNTLSFEIQAVDENGNLHDTDNAVFDVTLKGFDFLRTFTSTGARCTEADGKCVTVSYVGSGGRYAVTFRPTIASDYLLEARLAEGSAAALPIKGSPWKRQKNTKTLNVVPNVPNMAESKFGGGGMSMFVSGEDASFTLYSRDTFGNSQIKGTANVSAEVAGGIPFTVIPVSVRDECPPPPQTQALCGLYSLSYLATVSGSYVIRVFMNGEVSAQMPVRGFPAETPDPTATGLPLIGFAPSNVPPCLDTCGDGKCCLVGEGASYGFIGVQNEFVIEARDSYGNKMTQGGQPFSIEVVGQTLGEGSIIDLGTGQYLARYKVLVKGIYTLSVRLRGMHIGQLYDICPDAATQCFRGSPYLNLDLSPEGTGLEGLVITGDHLLDPVLNPLTVAVQYTVKVDATDPLAQRTLAQNALTATLELVRHDKVVDTRAVTKVECGNLECYDFNFMTLVSGTWRLSLTSGDVHCVGSPFSLTIHAGAAVASKTVIKGSGRYGVTQGETAELMIGPHDMHDNIRLNQFDEVRYGLAGDGAILEQFNATVKVATYQSVGDWTGWFKASYVGPALPNVEFESKDYFLYVWVTGLPLPPIKVTVWRGDQDRTYRASNTVVYGEGLAVSTAGNPVTFTIELRDTNDLRLQGAGGDPVSVPVTDRGSGVQTIYTATYNTFKPGTYLFSQDINGAGGYDIAIAFPGQNGDLALVQDLTSLLTVVPAAPSAPNSVFSDNFAWLAAAERGLGTREAADRAEFAITLKDAFDNLVTKGPSLDSISVVLDGVARPLASVAGQFCTDKARLTRLTCQDFDLQGNARVWHDNDGMYRVTSAATASGSYSVSVYLDQTHINGSPVVKTVTSGAADVARSFIVGDGATFAQAGTDGFFTVHTRDSFGNSMDKPFVVSAAVAGPQNVAATITQVTLSTMNVLYEVTVAGSYTLDLTIDATAFPGSPFALLVEPGETSYTACLAEGAALTSAVAAKFGTFLITARDVYGNRRTVGGDDMQVAITGESLVLGTISDSGDGTYVGSYQISIAGSYGLSLLLSTDEFFNSLVVCEAGSVDPETTQTLLPVPKSIQTGEIVSYSVQARDQFGSKIFHCREESLVTLQGVSTNGGSALLFNGTTTYPNGTVLCERGIYQGSFMASVTGQYTAAIKLANMHIFGSPFDVEVKAGRATSHQCFASGSQLIIAGTPSAEQAEAGKPATFTIQSRDAFGNHVLYDPFSVLMRFNVTLQLIFTTCDTTTGQPLQSDAVCQLATVVGNQDSTFSVSYTPTYAGKFEVVTTLVDENNNFQLISNSPFTTVVYPSTPDTRRTVMFGLPSNVTASDSTNTFGIQARDRFDNRVTVGGTIFDAYLVRRSMQPGVVAPVRFNAAVDDLTTGEYEVSFAITAAGNYQMEVLAAGTRIFNSPQPIVVNPGGINYVVSEAVGNGVEGGIVDYTASFQIIARDIYGNQLTTGGAFFQVLLFTPTDILRQDGQTNPAIPPEITDNGDGTYSVVYGSAEIGAHVLSVAGVNVLGTRIVTNGYNDQNEWRADNGVSEAGRCVAHGAGTVGGWVGEESTFTVQMRMVNGINRFEGGRQVTATMQSALDVVPITVDVAVTDNGDGTYTGRYTPRRATQYILTVRLGDTEILGSPFTVTMRPMETSALDSAVTTANLLGVVGEAVTFTIQAKDSYGNLQVFDEVRGPDAFAATLVERTTGQSLEASLQNNEDGTYILSYQATVSGSYDMRVRLGSTEVPSGVFQELQVLTGTVVTDKCSASGVPFSTVAGGSQQLLVDARDIYGNLVPEGAEVFNVTLSTSTGIVALGQPKHCGADLCFQGGLSCPCPGGVTPGRYALAFAITELGSYSLRVTRAGFDIPGFPRAMRVEASFAATHKTTVAGCEGKCSPQMIRCTGSTFACSGCTCPLIANIRAGVPTTFDLQTRDSFGNKVSVGRKAFRVTAKKKNPPGKSECLRSDGCEPAFVEATVVDRLDGTYQCSWTLSSLGDYDVSVTRSDEHIEGSPFSLTVEPGLASSAIDGSNFALDPVATAGFPRSFMVYARDLFGNRLTRGGETFVASLAGIGLLDGTFVPGVVEDYDDGSYMCYFQTVQAGKLNLEVQLNGEVISPGTVEVTVLPARARVDFSTIRGTGLSSLQAAGSTATDAFYVAPEIRIIARDSFRNMYNFDGLQFEVKVNGPQPRSLNSTDKSVSVFRECGQGCGEYVFYNSLQVSGDYTLSMFLHNKDSFGRITSSDKLNQNDYAFRVSGAQTSSPNSYFTGAGAVSCTVDQTCRFQVQAVDAFDNVLNQGGDVFVVSLTYIATDATRLQYPATVVPANASSSGGVPYNQGLYDVAYKVTVSGSYLMQITRYGESIKGSPKIVTISHGAVRPEHCTAFGNGHLGGGYNPTQPLYFQLQMRDFYGNMVTGVELLNDITMTTSPSVPLSITNDKDSILPLPTAGVYWARYEPSGAGTYQLHVKVLGYHISGSPFSATVVLPTAPSSDYPRPEYTVAIGEAAKKITVGVPSSFDIYPMSRLLNKRPAANNYLMVLTNDGPAPASCGVCSVVGMPKLVRGAMSCCVEPGNFASDVPVRVHMLTSVAGVNPYILGEERIDVTAGYVVLSGSPFALHMVPGPVSPFNCTIESLSIQSVEQTIAGFPNQIRLIARDFFGNQLTYRPELFSDLTISITDTVTSDNMPFGLNDEGSGSFYLSYRATKSGSYRLSATLGSQNWGSNPNMVITVSPDSMTTRVSDTQWSWTKTGSNVLATAGVDGTITVQARDVYGNRLSSDEASFQMLVTGKGTELLIPSYASGGSYTASTVMTVSATYSVAIYAMASGCSGAENCNHVFGSPYTVVVGPSDIDPARCTVSGAGKRTGQAADETTFSINMRDRYNNRVTVLPPNAEFQLTLESTASLVAAPIHRYDAQGPVPVKVVGVFQGVDPRGWVYGFYRAPMDGVYRMRVTYDRDVTSNANDNVSGNGAAVPTDAILLTSTSGPACGASLPCPVITKAYPPSVSSAMFSDSGGHIYIQFDKQTDKSNQQGTFPCSEVFTSHTMSALAQTAQANCVWVSPTELDVTLEFGATIQINDDLIWSPNKIRLAPSCIAGNVCFKHSRPVEGSARVGRPANPIQPTAILKAPLRVGKCDAAVLDASASTGSGGRSLTYLFGLEPGSPNDAQVRSFVLGAVVKPFTKSQLVLPPGLLLPGVSYTFLVRATNFLDQSSLASVVVNKVSESGPVVEIEGPSTVNVQTSAQFKLRGSAVLSACASSPGDAVVNPCCAGQSQQTGALVFGWSLLSVTPPLAEGQGLTLHQTKSTRQLFMPANSLIPGHVYRMQLRASIAANASVFGVATVDVNCYFAPLVAKVSGGDRALSSADDVLLDATGSIDKDGAHSSVPFSFKWTCATPSGGACFQDDLSLLLTNAGRLFLPAGTLQPGCYYFTAVASKEPGPRVASAVVQVIVVPVDRYPVSIEPLGAYKFNTNEELQLNGRVDKAHNCSLMWSQTAGDSVLSHGSYLKTPITLASILFHRNVLEPGAKYGFRLSATCEVSQGVFKSGSAVVSVRMNAAPSSGLFDVEPRAGVASSTYFKLSCINWVDDLEDLPFRYEFRYATQGAPADLIPLGSVDVNFLSTTLVGPTAAGQVSHTVSLYAHVIDQFYGMSNSKLDVTVSRPSGARRQATVAGARAALDRAILEQNAEAIISTTIGIAAMADVSCSDQQGFITTLQTVSGSIVMTASEIAGFQSALASVVEGTCVQGGSRRLLADSTVCNALGMTSGLLTGTMSAGLDPTAEKSTGSTLSSTLDTISAKNSQRRRLRELLGISAGSRGEMGGRTTPPFRRGGGAATRQASGCQASQGNMLFGALAGLADSQLNGAVTGQDPSTLQRGSIAMRASQALASSFMGASLNAGGSSFKTPTDMFATGTGASLKARTSNLGSSPFDSDYLLGGVSSLTFGVAVDNLAEPIELSMAATITSDGSVTKYACASTGASNGQSFNDAASCAQNCKNAPANASLTNATANATAGVCTQAAASSCGDDLWAPCVNGQIDTCMFWNGNEWDGEGCIVHQMDLAGKKLVCHCYHLTDFGGAASDVLPEMAVVDPTNPAALFENFSPDKILVICIVVGMLVGYWCLCYWGWRQDQIDNVRYEDEMGAMSRKMTKKTAEREDADMLLESSNMALLQKQMKGQFTRNIMMVKDKAMSIVRSKHKLFAAFLATRTYYTRPRRFTVLFCMIMGNMVLNAVFSGTEGTSFVQKIIGGIFSSLIMLLPTFFFKRVFMTMGVDPRTRARWEKQDEIKFKQRRAELALTVTKGPTAGGMAAPPSSMMHTAPPQNMRRGFVPHPDQERMVLSGVQGEIAGQPRRFKRKSGLPPPPSTGRPGTQSSSSTYVGGGNFGQPLPPPPPPGRPAADNFTHLATAEEPDGTPLEVGQYIPRRALPLSTTPRPPAPVMTPTAAEQQGLAGEGQDDAASVRSGAPGGGAAPSVAGSAVSPSRTSTNRPPPQLPDFAVSGGPGEEGREMMEGVQGQSGLHRKKEAQELKGLAKFEATIATKVARKLSQPKRELTKTRSKRLIDYRFQYLAYLMAFMWYMIAAYFAILYGLKFSTAIEQAWLIAFFVSVLQDLFVNETLILSTVTSIKFVALPNIAGWMAGRIVSRYQ